MSRRPWMAFSLILIGSVVTPLAANTDALIVDDPVGAGLENEAAWAPPELLARPAGAARDDMVKPPGSVAAAELPLTPDERLVRRSGSEGVAGEAATTPSVWRTVLASVGVVALILLLAYGYRALQTSSGRVSLLARTRRPYLIEVVARAPLSGRQTLCLVRVGPRLVLTSVSPQRVDRLDVIEDPQVVAAMLGERGEATAASEAAFQRQLDQAAGAFEQPTSELDDAPQPTTSRRTTGAGESALQNLRAKLQRMGAAGG